MSASDAVLIVGGLSPAQDGSVWNMEVDVNLNTDLQLRIERACVAAVKDGRRRQAWQQLQINVAKGLKEPHTLQNCFLFDI